MYIYLFISLILICLLIYIYLKSRKKLRKKILILPPIPAPLSTFKLEKQNEMILIQAKNTEYTAINYCKKHKIDYYPFVESDLGNDILIIINNILRNYNYKYVIFLGPNLTIIDENKSFDRIIQTAGDNELILCRDENNPRTVSFNCFIFRKSEWSLYKLQQLYKSGFSYNTITDQIYTDYNQPSLLRSKKYVDRGIPYLNSGVTIFNEHSFNSSRSSFIRNNLGKGMKHIDIYPWKDIYGFYEIKKEETYPEEKYNEKRKIPRNIFQTMETNLISSDMNEYSRKRLIGLNPNYKYFYYNSLECLEFIKNYFEPHVLYCYKKLLPGAFKSDLWRYCVLYKYGGVYCDSRFVPLVPFDDYITDDLNFVIPNDPFNGLWQGFMAVSPKHPFIKYTIDLTCRDILLDRYVCPYTKQVNPLNITGPRKIGLTMNLYCGRKPQKSHLNGIYVCRDLKYKILIFNPDKDASRPYINDGNKKVAIHKYNGVVTEGEDINFNMLSGKEYYAYAYENRRIYKNHLPIVIYNDKCVKYIHKFSENFSNSKYINKANYKIFLWTSDKIDKFLTKNYFNYIDYIKNHKHYKEIIILLILYVYGGIYINAKYVNIVNLDYFLPESKDVKIMLNEDGTINKYFFSTVPQTVLLNKFLKLFLERKKIDSFLSDNLHSIEVIDSKLLYKIYE